MVESTSTRSGLTANGVHVAGRGGRRRNKGFGYIDRLMQPGTSRCGYKLTRTRCDNICVTADRQQRKEQPSERLASTIERQITKGHNTSKSSGLAIRRGRCGEHTRRDRHLINKTAVIRRRTTRRGHQCATDYYLKGKKKRKGRTDRPNITTSSAHNGAKVIANTGCGDRSCGNENVTLRNKSEDYSVKRVRAVNIANTIYKQIKERNNTWLSFKERIITDGLRTIQESLVRAPTKGGGEALNQHNCSSSKYKKTTSFNKRSGDITKEQTTKISSGKMSENHNVLTHDTVEVKIENLKKVYDEHAEKKRQRLDGDESSVYDTVDLIDDDDRPQQESTLDVIEETGQTKVVAEPTIITAEDEFIPVGPRGKVSWTFDITAVTTDEEIAKQGPGSLTNAVIQVEKMLNKKIQDVVSPMGPRDLAKKARNILIREIERKQPDNNKTYMIPNPILEIDPTTQQTPGVPVTRTEQNLADAGALEYTMQIELNVKNGNELAVFQQFTNKVFAADRNLQFLPWYRNDKDDMVNIDRTHTPYQTVRGEVRLKHYMGPYNRTKNRVYGRVKVRTDKKFDEIKQHIVEWLRKDMHWVKPDYIQAKRISNIGLLLGTYNAVDMAGTRTALENAVHREIGRRVPLDLRLRRFRYKINGGRSGTTTAYGVSVDSRQVSEATKGLRAVLNKNCVPPTGRKIEFLTRAIDNPVIQDKNDKLIAKHHEEVMSERRLFRKVGTSLEAVVTLKTDKQLTLQQALCAITATNDTPLFTGVERMGKTDTSLFTTNKRNLVEAKRTLHSLPQVLSRILTEDSYRALGLGLAPQQEPEYMAMIQQESDYLDGLLNLKHCTEIDITRKRKKDDETVGAQTAVSGLTNVSPQTRTTAGSSAWTTPIDMDIDDDEPAATQVTSTLTTTHPDIAKLEKETNQQKVTINNMEKQIRNLQQSVQELVQYKNQEEESKAKFSEWQQQMRNQLNTVGGETQDTKRGQMSLQQDMDSVRQDLRNIMILLQGGSLSAPQPANPSQANDIECSNKQGTDPGPPIGGAGNI